MYVKWFDTVIFYFSVLSECDFLHFLISRRFLPPYFPTLAGNGTRKTDAGIGQRRWPGMLQGGHRRSAGQGKCRRDP
ncbi:unnamed protein product [Staurois parvus]|uniref:Secreted protein n=1 Tax=Staurois parvus TaxID=386267 RepID=A0ABN9GQ90_9NEOB|nr:unnamed protein product [Staurois parvus]